MFKSQYNYNSDDDNDIMNLFNKRKNEKKVNQNLVTPSKFGEKVLPNLGDSNNNNNNNDKDGTVELNNLLFEIENEFDNLLTSFRFYYYYYYCCCCCCCCC